MKSPLARSSHETPARGYANKPRPPAQAVRQLCESTRRMRARLTRLFGNAPTRKEITNELRHTIAIRFAIKGDLRFVSHQDTMRLFERALRRADLPVRYSEGFNPRPRLSLPLPRNVGIATEDDMLVVDLTEPVETCEVLRRLSGQMPTGVTLVDSQVLSPGARSEPERVEYTVELPTEIADDVRQNAHRFMEASTWPMVRPGHGRKPNRSLDLRPLIGRADVQGHRLSWSAKVSPQGSARPAEFLDAVGLPSPDWLHRVVRTRIRWKQGPSAPAPDAAANPTEPPLKAPEDSAIGPATPP